jgi:GTP-binding protein
VQAKVSTLFSYQGLRQVPVESLSAGDIAVIAGLDEVNIGDTIADPENPEALPRLTVEPPTVGMFFSINDGPFAGKDGDKVTSRNILDRLRKELLQNVSLRLEMTEKSDTWKVMGRGELQLAILLEQMRREGYEVVVSQPQVLMKKEDGELLEPMEEITVDLPDIYIGVITETLGTRKGIMTDLTNKGSGRARLVFKIPTRGLIGYRSEFLTETHGAGLLSSRFLGYEKHKGEIKNRKNGAMVADRAGKATGYSLFRLEPRGRLFITPGTPCYMGMIIGEHAKEADLEVNITKEKKLTNVRASGSDEAIKLTPIQPMTLERAMEWINQNELIEITPNHIRLRCRELIPYKRK